MKPRARLRSSRAPKSVASRLDVRTTRVAAPLSAIRSATSNPSVSGNKTSSSTTWGRSASTAASADAPSPASPTTSKPPASSRRRAKPRKRAWSSTISSVCGMSESSAILDRESASGIPRIVASRDPGPGDLLDATHATRPSVGGMHNSIFAHRRGGRVPRRALSDCRGDARAPTGRRHKKAIRTIAESGGWTGRWLVHVTGIVLIVVAVAVVTTCRRACQGVGCLGQPLFVMSD